MEVEVEVKVEDVCRRTTLQALWCANALRAAARPRHSRWW